MTTYRKAVAVYAVGSLSVAAGAIADLASRTMALRDAASATALNNATRPTQLNVTTDR